MKQFLVNWGILPASAIKTTALSSIYDIDVVGIDGVKLDLKTFQGRKILFVNVASKCLFTTQYKELQELFDQNKEKLVVIGVPCNQFGNQEAGSNLEIKSFCDFTYRVTFPLTTKMEVKGEKIHPLYDWLTSKKLNGRKNSVVKWNFQKYLVDENGQLVDVFLSSTNVSNDRVLNML